MAWLFLVLAGLFEVAWALGLKFSEGFSRPGPTLFTLVALVASMWLLAVASKSLPIGTAYAVWVGIGAAGAAVGGVILFREPVNPGRVLCLVMLVASIAGLKLTSTP